MLRKTVRRWLVICETKRRVMKLMDIKELRRRNRIGKEEYGVNFMLAELEILDGHAEISTWHWRLGLELQQLLWDRSDIPPLIQNFVLIQEIAEPL